MTELRTAEKCIGNSDEEERLKEDAVLNFYVQQLVSWNQNFYENPYFLHVIWSLISSISSLLHPNFMFWLKYNYFDKLSTDSIGASTGWRGGYGGGTPHGYRLSLTYFLSHFFVSSGKPLLGHILTTNNDFEVADWVEKTPSFVSDLHSNHDFDTKFNQKCRS